MNNIRDTRRFVSLSIEKESGEKNYDVPERFQVRSIFRLNGIIMERRGRRLFHRSKRRKADRDGGGKREREVQLNGSFSVGRYVQ